MEQDTPTYSGSAKFAGTLLLLVAAVISAGAYALHERSTAQHLSAQNDQTTAALQQMRTEMASLKAQLASTTILATTRPTGPAATSARATNHTIRRKHVDDPRWKKVQSQLDQQSADIASTRKDLANARTELQSSIASTHDELVVLEKKGERNYYEFDLDKAKQFTPQGPIGLRLRKANTKHQYADVELMVDDTALAQKHVNLLQPVVFYAAEGGRPVELVINKITRNHIHGYVSEPKYKASELAAAPASGNAVASGSAVPSNASARPRPRLELPK